MVILALHDARAKKTAAVALVVVIFIIISMPPIYFLCHHLTCNNNGAAGVCGTCHIANGKKNKRQGGETDWRITVQYQTLFQLESSAEAKAATATTAAAAADSSSLHVTLFYFFTLGMNLTNLCVATTIYASMGSFRESFKV